MKHFAFSVCVLAAAFTACVEDSQTPPLRTSVGRRPIINGAPATDARFDPIVGLYHQSGVMCSGTLVTRRVVLTAAHCVHGLSAFGYSVFFGTDMNGAGTWIGVAEIWEHPGYVLNESDPNQPTTLNDIALLRLNREAPANIQPIPYLPSSLALTQADVGTVLTFVGFGKTETGSVGRKLYVEGSLGGVCDGPGNCVYGGGLVYGPHYIAFSMGAGGPCSGDSGGPALVTRNGQWYVAGVASFVDLNCQYFGASTKVDAYTQEIEDFIGNAVPEDCTNGLDDDSDGLADCSDPECGSSPYCSGATACEQATSLVCGQVVSGSTAGGSQRFWDYGCPHGDMLGPEVAYQLSIPLGTHVRIRLTPQGGADLDLFLLGAGRQGGCDPGACLQASTGTGEESLSVTLQEASFLVVDTKGSQGGSFQLEVTCPAEFEECGNGVDDDGDGATDCADPDCAAECGGAEECGNGVDDDGDGATDCADPDCAAECGTEGPIHVVGGCRTVRGTFGQGGVLWLFWLLTAVALVGRRLLR